MKVHVDKNGEKYTNEVWIWNKEDGKYEVFHEGSSEFEAASKEMLLINVGRKRKRAK